MMCTDTRLHADQARRHIGEPCFHLAPRPLMPEHDCTTIIETNDVERVLADIDTDHGGHTDRFLSHGVLLSLSASVSLLADSAGARPDHPISGLAITSVGLGLSAAH